MCTGTRRSRADAAGLELLDRVGLGEPRPATIPTGSPEGSSSGSAIARAIATTPELLLLDEITSALDPELVGEVLDLVRALADDGTTIVMATHEMAFARDVARPRACSSTPGDPRAGHPRRGVRRSRARSARRRSWRASARRRLRSRQPAARAPRPRRRSSSAARRSSGRRRRGSATGSPRPRRRRDATSPYTFALPVSGSVSRVTPTSSTAAPGFTSAAATMCLTPAAATMTSACRR